MTADQKAVFKTAGPDSPQPYAGLDVVMLGDVALNLNRPYVVKGLIGAQELAVFYGESGCGKTFLAGHVAFCVSTGRECLGRRTQQGLVVYLAAEAPGSFMNRIVAIKKEYAVEQAPLAVIRNSLNFVQRGEHGGAPGIGEDVRDVIKACVELAQRYHLPIVLVIIDTVSSVMSGENENAPDGMGAFIAAMRAIRNNVGCAVLGVHHAGKNEAAGARGHSSLKAAVDAEIHIVHEGEQRQARITKLRDGEIGGSFAFELDQVVLGVDQEGDLVTTCLVRAAEASASAGPSAKLSGQETQAFASLAMLANGSAARRDAWFEHCRASGIIDPSAKPEAAERQMSRMIARLKRAGLVDNPMRGMFRPLSAQMNGRNGH